MSGIVSAAGIIAEVRKISPPLQKNGHLIFSASQFFVNQCGHAPRGGLEMKL
ncbi:MAG: hypothetical protein LBB21_03390 [Holosporaceae bacterium]|jgi:hypothetical protein|nr:hypothetical protein [Holosporaceae bacterium]